MKTKANTGIKMLNDLVDEQMTEEQIKSLNEYCEKLDEAQRKKPFMIVSSELAEVLNSLP
jgi:hypothetical protein